MWASMGQAGKQVPRQVHDHAMMRMHRASTPCPLAYVAYSPCARGRRSVLGHMLAALHAPRCQRTFRPFALKHTGRAAHWFRDRGGDLRHRARACRDRRRALRRGLHRGRALTDNNTPRRTSRRSALWSWSTCEARVGPRGESVVVEDFIEDTLSRAITPRSYQSTLRR